jgi:hypothetical protein
MKPEQGTRLLGQMLLRLFHPKTMNLWQQLGTRHHQEQLRHQALKY